MRASTSSLWLGCGSCCVLVAVCTSCTACTSELGHPPYWEIENADGDKSVLLGTMHAEADSSVLADEVWTALHHARIVVTEADVRAVDEAEFRALRALPDGAPSVREAAGEQDWEHIAAAVDGLVDEASAERTQPWFLDSTAVDARLPAVDPIDAALVTQAFAVDVELGFFETWQEQVAILNGVPFDESLDALVRTARDIDAAVDVHLEWADAYRRGDLERMTALGFDADEMAARPAFYRDVVGRHPRWLAQLEAEVDAGDAFIAVGFLHVIGTDGLAERLSRDGYRVTIR